jgi:hypothetical protein
MGVKGRGSSKQSMATAGIALCCVCILASISTIAWGTYLIVTGQHQFYNAITHQGQQPGPWVTNSKPNSGFGQGGSNNWPNGNPQFNPANPPAPPPPPRRKIDSVREAIIGLADSDRLPRGEALRWLRDHPIDAADAPLVINALRPLTLQSADFFTQRDAIRIFCKLARTEELGDLDNMLASDSRERGPILAAIVRLDPTRIRPMIEKSSSDFGLRMDAQRALIDNGPASEDAVIPLLTSDNREIQDLAFQVLAAVGTEKTAAALEQASQKIPDANLRQFNRSEERRVGKEC